MSSLRLAPVEGATLRLTPSLEGSTLTVVLSGSADLAARPLVESLLKSLHDEVSTSNITVVVMDVRDLTFMNSSCIKEFLTWLRMVRELDVSRRYEVRFLSNPLHAWQKRTLQSLRATAVGVVVDVT
jgi:hypothetical protein